MENKPKSANWWLLGLVALVYMVVGFWIYLHYHQDTPELLEVIAAIGAICAPFVAIIAARKDGPPENPD